MVRDIPFGHDDFQNGEDDHEVPRVFLSTDKISDTNYKLFAQFFERRPMLEHEII